MFAWGFRLVLALIPLGLLVLLVLALRAPQPRPVPFPDGWIVAPLGDVPPHHIALVAAALTNQLQIPLIVRKPIPLPPEAFYKPRQRHLAGKINDIMAAQRHGEFSDPTIVAVTTSDISMATATGGDWGIFGYAQMPGRACVVSSFRLKKDASSSKIAERLSKIAAHEASHTLGLPHCETPRCLMNDAKGKIATVDQSTGALCPACRQKIGLP